MIHYIFILSLPHVAVSWCKDLEKVWMFCPRSSVHWLICRLQKTDSKNLQLEAASSKHCMLTPRVPSNSKPYSPRWNLLEAVKIRIRQDLLSCWPEIPSQEFEWRGTRCLRLNGKPQHGAHLSHCCFDFCCILRAHLFVRLKAEFMALWMRPKFATEWELTSKGKGLHPKVLSLEVLSVKCTLLIWNQTSVLYGSPRRTVMCLNYASFRK